MMGLIILTYYSSSYIISTCNGDKTPGDFCSSSQRVFCSKESKNSHYHRTEVES